MGAPLGRDGDEMEGAMEPRNIRVSTSDFGNLRRDGAVYVDKTALVYALAREDRAIFLSRPRRFGKSLLVSVLEAYFEGRRDLFDGLAVSELETDWIRYPVLKFDLSLVHYASASDLSAVLTAILASYESIYGRTGDDSDNPGLRLRNLIRRAAQSTGQQVVVLIDEYDAPLLDTMRTPAYEPLRDMLQGFYKVLKESTAYLRFVFLTGITQFSQLNIFSALNNLTNITMIPKYASICGITSEEIVSQLMPEVESMAASEGLSVEALLSALKRRYDGYHFTRNCPDIYNPFSLLNCLKYQRLDNYWYSTGTPTLLTKEIAHFAIDPEKLEGFWASEMDFNVPIETAETPIAVLYQSGYVTMKSARNGKYRLGFPNEEVRVSFLKGLMPYYSKLPMRENASFVVSLTNALEEHDVDRAMVLMRSFIGSIPYNAERQDENHYKTIFYLVFRIASEFCVRTEACTSSGRIDTLIETDDSIYLFEFKLDGSAEEALKQIDEKGYAIQYEAGAKRVVKIGVNFDKDLRTIDRWIVAGDRA